MTKKEQEKYIKELEETISQFIKPLKNIPFKIVLKAISECELIPFDKNNPKDKQLLDDLIKAATIATNNAYEKGIFTRRENEVGNHIEPFVIDALNQIGLVASRPKTKEGKKKATGYPDIFLEDRNGRPNYIECKTYNERNYQTTQRSFYFSPAERTADFKVIHDARHLVISFKIEKSERDGQMVFFPVYWKIFSLDSLIGQIKHEFNSTNKQLYRDEALLAEGSI
ncbi:MAG: hypothetical protein WBH58_08075 [Bacteroidales bacterium]|jgi:hypothetical protein|nr:hypothetical protein [Bacteroidales bacterium]MDI9575147.1 hypothetical protein [Bacteroidota bacterium]MDD2593860.1 hypothetical protein [Bacteroidales bacterium]MDD3756390.1 hypothetical protein [Bacteroidales bacterium]MDY0401639.1 hypothetical protein [Bacteroidales bacterium]